MKRIRRWLVVVAFLPAPAFADAAESLETGLAAFRAFDYEKAQASLSHAVTAPDATPTMRAQAELYLGLCGFEQGDDFTGASRFRRALTLDPELKLPGIPAPKIAAAFAKIKEEIRRVTVQKEESRRVTVQEVRSVPDSPPPPTAPAAAVDAAPPATRGLAPYVTGGVAATALATAIGLHLSASATLIDLGQNPRPGAQVLADYESARTRGITAEVLYAVGATLAVVAMLDYLGLLRQGGSAAPAPRS